MLFVRVCEVLSAHQQVQHFISDVLVHEDQGNTWHQTSVVHGVSSQDVRFEELRLFVYIGKPYLAD